MNIIERARNLRKLIQEYAEKSEDKTLVIATSNYFEKWKPGIYNVGDIRLNRAEIPKECMIAHDSTVNTDWTIDTSSIWKSYHSKKAEYALPFEKPTGAHDMYKVGEYMIWTDGKVYECLSDTTYSPNEYMQAWKVIE